MSSEPRPTFSPSKKDPPPIVHEVVVVSLFFTGRGEPIEFLSGPECEIYKVAKELGTLHSICLEIPMTERAYHFDLKKVEAIEIREATEVDIKDLGPIYEVSP